MLEGNILASTGVSLGRSHKHLVSDANYWNSHRTWTLKRSNVIGKHHLKHFRHLALIASRPAEGLSRTETERRRDIRISALTEEQAGYLHGTGENRELQRRFTCHGVSSIRVCSA